MDEAQTELFQTKQEPGIIQNEHNPFKNDVTISGLINTVNEFQGYIFKCFDTIQENLNSLSGTVGVLSTKVSNSEKVLSEIVIANDTQSKTSSNSLEVVQKDLAALSENVNALSKKVSTNDEVLSDIKDILKGLKEILSKQSEDIQLLSTTQNDPEKETILLVGGWDGEKCFKSLLILENNGSNWKQLFIKLPYSMFYHGAQFLNNHLYIFGGHNAKYDILDSTYRLSTSMEWESMAEMNEKRCQISNSSVVLYDQIWVCGGYTENEKASKSVEMYDPETNNWSFMKEMNECREDGAAAIVDGKIFCCGGWGKNEEYLDSAECYDPSSDIWTPICNMPRPNAGHAAIEVDGKLVVIGGRSSKTDFLNSVWILDTINENTEWIDKAYMSIPRNDLSIAKINDRIFVCGGECKGRIVDDVEIFDGEAWSDGPKLTTGREGAVAIVIPKNFAKYLK